MLSDDSGAHHPLSPMIKLGIRHPRNKEKKNGEIAAFQTLAIIMIEPPARVVILKGHGGGCVSRLFKYHVLITKLCTPWLVHSECQISKQSRTAAALATRTALFGHDNVSSFFVAAAASRVFLPSTHRL